MADQIPVITSSDELKSFCQELAARPFVAVDTEFMRQTTYRPKLCLIQVAGPGRQSLIDPLAPGIDLAPFFELMADRRVLKVFHAARQDIEVIYQESGVIPEPLFDTQIAAMALGYGESISYSMLVKRLLRRDLDKSYQVIDWTQRPMSQEQLEYALGDVTYLLDIYRKLDRRLRDLGRDGWLKEEVAVLTDPRTYAFDPADAWKRMKMGGKSAKTRAIIRALSAWREKTAQVENVPRGRVLKDDVLYDIARFAPESLEALNRIRSTRDVAVKRGAEIVAVTIGALKDLAEGGQEDDLPRDAPCPAPATVEMLRVLLKAVSSELNIASKLLASADDLEKLAISDDADIPALRGWRFKAFGEKALALKRGKVALAVKNGRIAVLDIAEAKASPAPAAMDG